MMNYKDCCQDCQRIGCDIELECSGYVEPSNGTKERMDERLEMMHKLYSDSEVKHFFSLAVIPMYDELIKRLRECTAEQNGERTLWHQAADAIEELQKDLERLKDFEAFWQHEAEEALKKFQVAISNKPRWIPVTEQLPEDRKMVLATVNGVVCVAFYGNYMWEEVETYSIFYPTHWMPIPQPPEDGE